MRILHAIHDFLPRHRAGSEIYAHALAKAQQPRHEARVLCAEWDARRPHGSVLERSHDGVGVTEVVNNWAFDSFGQSWRPPALGRALERIVREARPDVLHVHNLLNLSLELPAIAARAGAAVVGTLHDYTLFCPSGGQRVHVAEAHVCFEIEPARCARCFVASPWWSQMGGASGTGGGVRGLLRRLWGDGPTPPTARDVEERLAAAQRTLAEFDLLVAPSRSLASEYRRLGAPADRLRVSDYGFRPLRRGARSPSEGPLRIGFAGTPIWHKGAHVLLEAVRRLPEGRWTLDIWGDLGVAPDYALSLQRSASGLPIRFRGAFDDETAPAAYAGMDVLAVPSLWLENSPLVVHEAFQAGVPVVAGRIGGLADLVTHERDGLLCDAHSAGSLAAALSRLVHEPGLVGRLAAGVPPVRSIEDDARDWDGYYAEARARRGHAAG